jgi:mannose-6-phosphate isomerase-like protein (cupin superfamily)
MTIPLSPLGERFENAAGWIQNLVEQPISGVAVIFSKAGSSRSHHRHRADGHFLYVESGRMLYVERGPDGVKRQREVCEGEMVWTGPGTEHSSYFPVDTLLLSLSLRSRTKAEHEADVVRCEPLPWSNE